MPERITASDVIGLVRPDVDAHVLGIQSVMELLRECGVACASADATVCRAFGRPEAPESRSVIEGWARNQRVSVLGFSYRLDPGEGVRLLAGVVRLLRAANLLQERGGPIKALYFAGLPAACAAVRREFPDVAGVFCGDETPSETLRILGISPRRLPAALTESLVYDEDRLAFGRELIRKGDYRGIVLPDRSGYPEFGTTRDRLTLRLEHARRRRQLPLTRAHMGPYLPDRAEAVKLFLDWTRRLAAGGGLDVLSIGTSQLTQSHFGRDWGDLPNGGGVPLNAPEEFAAAWQAARPMLVRSYAGTDRVPAMARMLEETVHNAWHALSLWWFCRIDGRGPHGLRENLEEQFETLRFIAAAGAAYEANVPHHFAFRGADDVTYIASAILAARAARQAGVRVFVLQNMLNTPKATWGIQDLAKARALLTLARELEGPDFRVVYQPRGGLDYFSPDLDKARAQLAAVTALMDDVEPGRADSPEVIHVVSYSEGTRLADPDVIAESVRITLHALAEYRRLRARGTTPDMAAHPEVLLRTRELLAEARALLDAVESDIENPLTPQGFYDIFQGGYLPVPYLWECREELAPAVAWQSRLVRGGVRLVDAAGTPLTLRRRVERIRGPASAPERKR